MQQISDKGLNLIKQFEGFKGTVYKDVAGYPTIGYGHKLTPGDTLATLTESDAEHLLESDLKACYSAISNLVLVPLAQGQFDALCSFIFNLGSTRFFNSTMRKMLNRGNYAGAALEFPKWVYANRVKQSGLVKRRAAEQALFRTV